MRRPGQRVVLRTKNDQQIDHQMMTETAPGSKLKLTARYMYRFNFQIGESLFTIFASLAY